MPLIVTHGIHGAQAEITACLEKTWRQSGRQCSTDPRQVFCPGCGQMSPSTGAGVRDRRAARRLSVARAACHCSLEILPGLRRDALRTDPSPRLVAGVGDVTDGSDDP